MIEYFLKPNQEAKGRRGEVMKLPHMCAFALPKTILCDHTQLISRLKARVVSSMLVKTTTDGSGHSKHW